MSQGNNHNICGYAGSCWHSHLRRNKGSNLFAVLREQRIEDYPGPRTMERIARYYGTDYADFMAQLTPTVEDIPQPWVESITPYERCTMDTLDLIHAELVRIRELFEKIWL